MRIVYSLINITNNLLYIIAIAKAYSTPISWLHISNTRWPCMTIGSTVVDMVHFWRVLIPASWRRWKGQNNAYLLHPPSPPRQILAPHNASVVTVPADKPPRDKPQKLKYPGRPLLCPPPQGHPVCSDWGLQLDDSDGDRDYGRGLLPQPHGVNNCVIPGGCHRDCGGARGVGPGHEGAAIGMNFRIRVLPQAERAELKNIFWRTADPTHQKIPPTIKYWSRYWYWRYFQPLPVEGPYCHGLPESGHWPPSEPAGSTGAGFPSVLQTGWPSQLFLKNDCTSSTCRCGCRYNKESFLRSSVEEDLEAAGLWPMKE